MRAHEIETNIYIFWVGNNTTLIFQSYYAFNANRGVKHFREEQEHNISKALMKPLAIPLIHQKTMDKRLVIVATVIAAFFSLNALAAENASPANDVPAAGPSAKPEERNRNQQDIRQEMRDHWENMSPEEREQVRNKMKNHWKNMTLKEREARRKEMREHFKNMSPEERQQLKRDMGKDGTPPSDGDFPGGNTGNAGRPVK